MTADDEKRRALGREYAKAEAQHRFGIPDGDEPTRSRAEINADLMGMDHAPSIEPANAELGAAGLAEAERRFSQPRPPQPPSAFDQARADQADRDRDRADRVWN